MPVQHSIELREGDAEQLKRCERPRAGGMPAFPAEHAHLTQDGSFAAQGQHALVGCAKGFNNFNLAIQHKIEILGQGAFMEQDLTCLKVMLLQRPRQLFDLIGRQAGKQRKLADHF